LNNIWGSSYKELVLKELRNNCRRSDRDISKAIKVHPSTVGRIRNTLEEEGKIFGYTVCRDYLKANYNMMLICLKTSTVDEAFYHKIRDILEQSEPDIGEREPDTTKEIILIDFYECVGKYDFMLTVASKEALSLKRFINEMKRQLDGWLEADIELINIASIFKKNEILNPYKVSTR